MGINNTNIELYPNIFTPQWCSNIIDKFKNYEFLPKNDYSIVVSNLDPILFQDIQFTFWEKLYPIYNSKHKILNRMNVGVINEAKLHQYKIHQSTIPVCCENHGFHPFRFISINIYLNTLKDGEDIFLNQNTLITPQQGGVAIYPSCYTHIHKSNIPQYENKYVLKTWVEFKQN